MFSFSFAPKGWADCLGQLLPINQNQALFALLGTQYGGNGQTNFALPNFAGRTMIHAGPGAPPQGSVHGELNHVLSMQEMPQHIHQAVASSGAPSTNAPGPTLRLASASSGDLYGPFSNPSPMAGDLVSNTGGSQPHNNIMPSAVLRICIALQGIFPSRN